MNEHPDERYVYITPYLDEAARIKSNCPGLHFIEPSDKIKQYGFKKTNHTAALIREGRNVATTHQAFKCYTQEMLDCIREQGYILVIDENVDVLESFDFSPDDLQLAVDAGYISEDDGLYSVTKHDYNGKALSELFSLLKTIKEVNSWFFC